MRRYLLGPVCGGKGGSVGCLVIVTPALEAPAIVFSMISQFRVRRSRRVVVIVASVKTLGYSPKARLVVTMIEVRS